jgi:hypothetical protein
MMIKSTYRSGSPVCSSAVAMMTKSGTRSTHDRAVDPRSDTTLEDAKAKMLREVYLAASYFERLESAQLIDGSGHHAAQAVAAFAVKDLEQRWKGTRDVQT